MPMNPDEAGKNFSIVVPTYREAENIPLLVKAIDSVLGSDFEYEILVVDDDSKDGIVEAVEALGKTYPVRIHVRQNPPRCLSSSVIDGIKLAKYQTVLVMDADLQHPCEKIPEMIKPVLEKKCTFSIASRFIQGAKTPGFKLHRQLNSFVATFLAYPLVNVSDPMSGFFAFDRGIINDYSILNPVGYKIALEIMVKCGCKGIVEVPITFGVRTHGESKLNLKEQLKYLRHLGKLYVFALFCKRAKQS